MSSIGDCEFVCSRGILDRCDVKSLVPTSSVRQMIYYDHRKIRCGCMYYVCTTALQSFFPLLDSISGPIILVTGDADITVPSDLFSSEELFLRFIEHPKIMKWCAQNCVIDHPKMMRIPIGLDYHTMSNQVMEWGPQMTPDAQEMMLKKIKTQSKSWKDRICLCYSNFHFFTKSRFGHDRVNAMAEVPNSLVYYEEEKKPREHCWKKQSEFVFVLSPHGNGLDCHRTWEALALGCIPIVKQSGLDPLYEGLPVLIVHQWSDVSQSLLEQTVVEFSKRAFEMERLTLNYWMRKIRYL